MTSHSDLALFGAILAGSQLREKHNQHELPKAKQEPEISHKDVMVSYIGLFGLGQNAYEAIEPFRADEDGFKLLLNLKAVPSCATLSQRLDQLAAMPKSGQLLSTLKEESLAILNRSDPCGVGSGAPGY